MATQPSPSSTTKPGLVTLKAHLLTGKRTLQALCPSAPAEEERTSRHVHPRCLKGFSYNNKSKSP